MRFGVIGLEHGHAYLMIEALLEAGAELQCIVNDETQLSASDKSRLGDARFASTPAEILSDDEVELVVITTAPDKRAATACAAMQAGKDVLVAKPAAIDIEQLHSIIRVQQETGRIWSVFYSEIFACRPTTKALELCSSGRIGAVQHVLGIGTHRIGASQRPAWFFEQNRSGGILADLCSHQVQQFLAFTEAEAAQVVHATTRIGTNNGCALEVLGEMNIRAGAASAYARVDWLSPESIPGWGDGRTFVLGASGYIEIRKTIDIGGQAGTGHLFVANERGIERVDCSAVQLPFVRTLVADIRARTDLSNPVRRALLATALALEAQEMSSIQPVSSEPDEVDVVRGGKLSRKISSLPIAIL